jgi:hypothetical protein
MNRSYLLTLLYLIISINLFSQTGTIKIARPKSKTDKKTKTETSDSTKHRLGVLPTISYVWQGYNNIKVGIMLARCKDDKWGNINLAFGVDLFQHHVTYASPFASLRYFGQVKDTHYFWSPACSYSIIKVNKIVDQRITPEIGVGIIGFCIFYGYNIPIAEQISFVSPHRIGLRLLF